MTEQEIKQLAMDIADGKVFTSGHVMEKHLLPMVFMPIALGAFKTEDEIKEIGLIYEYIDKAGPGSVNGLPIFYSFKRLDIGDLPTLDKYYNEINEFKRQFISTKDESTKDKSHR